MSTRHIRNLVQEWVPTGGAVLIFLALLFGSDHHPYIRLAVVLVGILVIMAGVWKVTNPLLPSERKYMGLRAEVDDFILLVRALNRTTLEARATGAEDEWSEVRELIGVMHASVDYMAELAGKTEEEVASGSAAPGGPEREAPGGAEGGASRETEPPDAP